MARVIVQDDGEKRTVELTEPILTFGRGPDNRVVLQDKSSSRRQFQIERTDQGYKMVDLESRNGTRVNESFVNQALLKPGDRIRVGKAIVTFEDKTAQPPPISTGPGTSKVTIAATAAVSAKPGPDETSPDPESPRRFTRRHKGSRGGGKGDKRRHSEENIIKVVCIVVASWRLPSWVSSWPAAYRVPPRNAGKRNNCMTGPWPSGKVIPWEPSNCLTRFPPPRTSAAKARNWP